MVCHTVNQTGMSCSRRNVSPAVSLWRRATGGSRRSTITTTVSASTARCAKRTSKDRVSSPREVGLSVRRTPASLPQIMYNSDTVYSTTTFRPVSPSPITPPAPESPSPQRTRKLETPLHFDGGLFSDIRSTEGKLLSKVTVDRLHSSTRHDITDSPSVFESVGIHGSKDYVNDIVKTETITNEDVIKVKFTPVPPEIDTPRLLTPSQFRVNNAKTPVEYIKDNYEDLHSYKIVSSLCKGKLFDTDTTKTKEKSFDDLAATEPMQRPHSPLANFLVSEQLTKIDTYLQESLDACSGENNRKTPIIQIMSEGDSQFESKEKLKNETIKETYKKESVSTYHAEENIKSHESDYLQSQKRKISEPISYLTKNEMVSKRDSKVNSIRTENQGVLKAIYNMPIHYHAAILCFILIVYNLVFQYIKKNCHGQK